MSKYGVVLRVALAERLVYRADFFVSTFLRFIPIITTIFLWRAIYVGSGETEIGGLHYTEIVSYYLFVMITRSFGSMPGLSYTIARDIRDGGLRKYLLQPIDYLTYLTTLRAAHKLIYFVMAAGPFAVIYWLCRRFLPGWPDWQMFATAIVSLTFCFALGFLINALIGMLGFWFLEVSSFIQVFLTLQYFLSGHMFPLSLLPEGVQRAVTWMPFAYETYYPTLILLQRLAPAEASRVIAVQAVWSGILLVAVRLAWRVGLRRYAAYGG